MPGGGEKQARRFYSQLLGLQEIEKPLTLKTRGDCWFRGQAVELHMGVKERFKPARKGHVAFLVLDLVGRKEAFADAGLTVMVDQAVENVHRFDAHDPFGNRLEFIQDGEGFSQSWRID
jgi:catechol 2,3-dioxygenase-like lactoylglutathione lyase family enzyme